MKNCLLAALVVFSLPALSEELQLPPGFEARLAQMEDPSIQAVAPFRIFDNLSYVGIEWVAAYVLETSEGLIVIDTLYGKWVDHLIDGLTRLGLNPEDIRYVLVTHGHFDHAGGAAILQKRYGARVVMAAEDWKLSAQPVGNPRFAFPQPESDIVAEDGDVIELGDTRVTLLKTPGHTQGVLSFRYSVMDGPDTYQAITLGGVGLNFSGVARTEAYITSYERLIGMQDDITVSLPNHASMADVFKRGQALRNRNTGDPHAFVDGAAYRQSLENFLAAAREKLVEEKASN
ncbi:MAG: MBL fold metallo-hydrolase [Gammaproteobacteria bacterium]|nr:MBL fold metallo-hydrolase [Gammaproteobacteria bacterium]